MYLPIVRKVLVLSIVHAAKDSTQYDRLVAVLYSPCAHKDGFTILIMGATSDDTCGDDTTLSYTGLPACISHVATRNAPGKCDSLALGIGEHISEGLF